VQCFAVSGAALWECMVVVVVVALLLLLLVVLVVVVVVVVVEEEEEEEHETTCFLPCVVAPSNVMDIVHAPPPETPETRSKPRGTATWRCLPLPRASCSFT